MALVNHRDQPPLEAHEAKRHKANVRAASTANVTLASAVENGDSFSGITLATGDSIGLFHQTAGAENGLYTVNASGAPTRRSDADSAAELFKGFLVYVEEGSQAGTLWAHTTTAAITLNTTALTFAQISGSGGGAASAVTFTPTGAIAATNVQAALAELDTEKSATGHAHAASDITSGTMATARLGSGTADNTTFLRGDQTYAVPSGGGSVATDAIWDAKGDLAGGTGANTAAKLTVGSNGQVLTADSGEATGLKWAAAGSGAVATDTIFDAKGDLAVGTGSDTAAKLTAGANDTILMADSGQSTGLKWVASQTPSTQAFSDAAAEGTADTYARGDHKHGMPASPGGGGGLYSGYLNYQDQKSSGTAGGTFTSGAWRTRDINTEHADTGNNGALATNQITLDAGTYDCFIRVPGMSCGAHQARLQNITDTATPLTGSSVQNDTTTNVCNDSIIQGTFTIAGAKAFEVQHQCTNTKATNGFGPNTGLGTQVFTVAEFWKRS